MPYVYDEPYNYPYGIYIIIRKFGRLNRQILEKTKQLASYFEIAESKHSGKFILFKEGSPFENIASPIKNEIEKALGDIFKGYEWLGKSYEAEVCKEYLRVQYLVTGVALRFFDKLSPVEACLESIFLERGAFRTGGSLSVWYKEKTKFFEDLNPLKIYLAVKYLEQLSFSKNRVRDKKLVSEVQKKLKEIEQDLQNRALTKEEWEKRDKAKVPVKY